MVLAVGDGAKDHFVRDGVAGEVGVGRWVGESVGCGGGSSVGFSERGEDDWRWFRERLFGSLF